LCQGDSGGPIINRNRNDPVQVGVVSWGFDCAQPGFRGIYARVSSAHYWIKQVVCDEWGASASFCDGGSTGGNCAEGELDFDVSITTYYYGMRLIGKSSIHRANMLSMEKTWTASVHSRRGSASPMIPTHLRYMTLMETISAVVPIQARHLPWTEMPSTKEVMMISTTKSLQLWLNRVVH
jgi:hypothetical protein